MNVYFLSTFTHLHTLRARILKFSAGYISNHQKAPLQRHNYTYRSTECINPSARKRIACSKVFLWIYINYCVLQAIDQSRFVGSLNVKHWTEMNSSVTKYNRKGLPLNAWICVKVEVRYTDCALCLRNWLHLHFVINKHNEINKLQIQGVCFAKLCRQESLWS